MSDLNHVMSPTVASDAKSLTPIESRAGLDAVGRVLDLARDQARSADPADMADILATAGQLPPLLAEPGEFRSRFRPTLQRLARRHPEFAPVLSEFDLRTWPKRRKTVSPEAELWIDCGVAD